MTPPEVQNQEEDAAIVVLAYRRPRHLAVVLQGLRDEGAEAFRVYIDAADTPEVEAAQHEIRGLLEAIDWADVDVHWRPEHLGLADAVCSALDETFALREQVILIEDDCAPRPGFLAFMRGALRAYQHAPAIGSICGYVYPVTTETSARQSIDAVRQRRFCPWGWATWRDRWRARPRDLRALIEAMSATLNDLPQDIQRDCRNQTILDGRGQIWSLPWILQHYQTDTWCITPPQSLVENIGFDGSGAHRLTTDHFTLAAVPGTTPVTGFHFPDAPTHDAAREAAVNAYLQDGPIFVDE